MRKQSEGLSSPHTEHLVDIVMYFERVHLHVLRHRTQLASNGQQFCMPVKGCVPQQTPGDVIMYARRQSFWRQQFWQPTLLSSRRRDSVRLVATVPFPSENAAAPAVRQSKRSRETICASTFGGLLGVEVQNIVEGLFQPGFTETHGNVDYG